MNPQEIISRATAAGSSATTLRGAAKYLVANYRPAPANPKYASAMVDEGSAQNPYIYQVYGHDKYRANEALRKANPEAKRARDDAGYRRNFLRRLAGEIKRLTAPPLNSLDAVCAAANSRDERNARLRRIAQLRQIALGTATPENMECDRIHAGILVSSFDAQLARKMGAKINMAGKDATIAATRRESYGVHVDAVPSKYRNGRWGGSERAQHDNYVRSVAFIRAPQTVDYIFHETKICVNLPTGMVWEEDQNGLVAFCGPDDYHPTAAELLAKNAVEIICEKLVANAETRKKIAAQKLVEAAEMAGVYVCVADSLRAGNCRAGTESFAARHNLSVSRHYSAPEILAQGNGDTGRVRLAIRAAIERTKIENERGFAVLAEHQI